jgi:hypothetical protein
MRLRHIVFQTALLTSAFFAATAAHASGLSEPDKARSTMRRVVSCAVYYNVNNRRGEGAVAVIEGDLSGEAFIRLYDNIESCVWQNSHDGRWVEQLRFVPALLKGEIFRSIVLDEWGTRARKDLLPELQRLANVSRDPSNNPLGAFGLCVAALDPLNARRAIEGPTAGPDENAAYAALGPSLAQCVAPGQQIAFSRQVLEDALAEGLFVLTYATSAKPPAARVD